MPLEASGLSSSCQLWRPELGIAPMSLRVIWHLGCQHKNAPRATPRATSPFLHNYAPRFLIVSNHKLCFPSCTFLRSSLFVTPFALCSSIFPL